MIYKVLFLKISRRGHVYNEEKKMNIRNCLGKCKKKCIHSVSELNRLRIDKKNHFRIFTKPKVVQLPITHLCNFDCVMCGMHHMISRKDFSSDELKRILSDELFTEVETIGVNGGEPFLKEDLIQCITVMLEVLPKLTTFNIISNGYFSEKIVSSLAEIKTLCDTRNVKVNLSLSLDGIGELQDFHRGHIKAYDNLENTLHLINENRSNYVDELNIICTITKYNIYNINEVEIWAERNNIDVAYNIATVNVRIENEDRLNDFSVFSEEQTRMLAQEFFYKKYSETKSERYYAIYLYLRYQKRYSYCPCDNLEWITLTPDSQIGFCATHSKKLGSGLHESAEEIVKKNLGHLKEIKRDYCSHCSHYIYNLNEDGLRMMHNDMIKNSYLR